MDKAGFDAEMAKQKERARNATANEFGDWTEFKSGEEVVFLGYDTLNVEDAVLLKHRTVKQKNKTFYQLVFDRTPFYAEMGGQVGDTGYVVSASGEKIAVINTVKENNLTIHLAERIPEDCTGAFGLHVDEARRKRIMANHTATHLLDNALRSVLGTHVEQKGSFVAPDYFRFDFSHFAKMTEEEISAVEHKVNEMIRADYHIEETRDATMEEANAMGAIALFGEKYGSRVRVVKFGPSVELCGGTHAAATGNIGFFKIVSEGAVAAGVRRIEAVTGEAAEQYLDKISEMLSAARAFFNNTPDLAAAIQKTLSDNEALKKEIEGFMAEKAEEISRRLIENAETVGNVKLIRFDRSLDPALVREAVMRLQKVTSGFIFAGAFEFGGKPNLVLSYSPDLVAAGKNAGKDIREAAKCIQGGGGGQPGFATAGGRNIEGLSAALDMLVDIATR